MYGIRYHKKTVRLPHPNPHYPNESNIPGIIHSFNDSRRLLLLLAAYVQLVLDLIYELLLALATFLCLSSVSGARSTAGIRGRVVLCLFCTSN